MFLFFSLIVCVCFAKPLNKDSEINKEKLRREAAIVSFKSHLKSKCGYYEDTIWFVDNKRNKLYKEFSIPNSKTGIEYNKEEINLFYFIEDAIRKADKEIGYIMFYTEEVWWRSFSISI